MFAAIFAGRWRTGQQSSLVAAEGAVWCMVHRPYFMAIRDARICGNIGRISATATFAGVRHIGTIAAFATLGAAGRRVEALTNGCNSRELCATTVAGKQLGGEHGAYLGGLDGSNNELFNTISVPKLQTKKINSHRGEPGEHQESHWRAFSTKKIEF